MILAGGTMRGTPLNGLSGWQRIGVVISVVWAVGAGIYARNADVERASNFHAAIYRTCTETKSARSDFDFSECSQDAGRASSTQMTRSWGNTAVVALVPIPFGWLAVLLILKVSRWVRAGFSADPN